jgi:hypothetical protein
VSDDESRRIAERAESDYARSVLLARAEIEKLL